MQSGSLADLHRAGQVLVHIPGSWDEKQVSECRACGNTAIFNKLQPLLGLHLPSFSQVNSVPSSQHEFSFPS